MRFLSSVAVAALCTGAVADQAAAFQNRVDRMNSLRSGHNAISAAGAEKRADAPPAPRYLTKKTKKFSVDGAKLPLVPFDVGESYAGSLPISGAKGENSTLFFWFFPSQNASVTDEITVWLNGGPGCSSLSGFLTENGPFLWQDGTLAPVENPYSWNKLTNMIWIEQPVGTGFAQGTPTIKDEIDLASQFRGFWKNFIDTFDQLKGAKTYLTGESYAGMYVPYIANSFLAQNDTQYFNLGGIAINDPVIGSSNLQFDMPSVPYDTYWANLLHHSEDTIKQANDIYESAGLGNYSRKYFTFPPPQEPFPVGPSLPDEAYYILFNSTVAANPCWNIYHISDMCPTAYSHLGGVNVGDYVPPGSEVYFQRSDVQRHIHAPSIGKGWVQCATSLGRHVFPEGDNSEGPAIDGTLQNIIEKTNNVMIGGGGLDYLVQTNGTLFAVQNITWHGHRGFHEYPKTSVFVPEHPNKNPGAQGSHGDIGVFVKERGLTFYEVTLAGHEVPGWALSGGYRVLQQLLGRIEDLSSKAPLF